MAQTNLYALIESRPGHPNFDKPFYIGIGTAKRPRKHLRDARSKAGHRNWRLQDVLAAHFLANIEPLICILAVYNDKESAALAEVQAIALYGRIGLDIGGILTNLAVGGQGPDADLMRMPEIRKRNSDAQKCRSPESRARSIAALAQNRLDPIIQARRAENSREPARKSWRDRDVRAKRQLQMLGKKKTMTPESITARQVNARLPRSQDSRARSQAASLRMWSDPAFRIKRSVNQAAAWQDPQKRANMLAGRSEAQIASWKDDGIRDRRITGLSQALADKWANDPDYAARSRAALRDSWSDPDKKAARVAKMLASRAAKKTGRGDAPTVPNADRSATMRAVNAAFSADDRSAVQQAAWSDPAIAERRRAGIKAAAQDPALKAARVAAMLAGKRRKAAERAAAGGSRDGAGG
jgi:hypothetical protein